MSTMNSIIKERRNALGITQKELADRLSISDKTVSRWESGNQVPDAILLPDLAEALNISINELYGIGSKTNKTSPEENSNIITSKFSEATNLFYRIAMIIGMVLFIFGSMVLIHINTIRSIYPENGERTHGNIFTYLGLIICIGTQIAYMILRRKKLYNYPLNIKSEITYGGICALSVLEVLLIVFPVCITIPINYSYELAVVILATGTLVMMFFQKQKLREKGIKIGKSIDIISASIWFICVIIFMGIWVYFTFIYKVEINGSDGREQLLIKLLDVLSGQSEIEYKTVRYSFLALALPLFSSSFINFVHLLIKSKKFK
ncbi:MAG: helix-turn-helix transcriptional regulator [Clostridia bacterium]|nr:helix-turn-helix transcriptional regulator [Clostridia bacterium]